MRKIPLILIFLLTFWGCSFFGYLNNPWVDIPNFYKVEEGLYRGGQPKEVGLHRLKEMKIKTIVNLRCDSKSVAKEKEGVLKLGMDFIHIPLSVMRKPTKKDIDRFLKVLNDKKKRPIFVHCRSGKNRTGTMIACYRVTSCGWPIEKAYKEARSFGFCPLCFKLREFILRDLKEYCSKNSFKTK